MTGTGLKILNFELLWAFGFELGYR